MHLWNDNVKTFYERLLEVKSEQTAKSYVHAVRLWEGFLVEQGVKSLDQCPPGFLDDFVRWSVKRGLSPQTVCSRTTGVKAWLTHLRRKGYDVPNFLQPDMPKVLVKEPRVLTLDELSRYFEAVNELHDPVKTALLLMPLCGLRSEEISKVALSALKVIDGWIVFTFTGKGRKARSVPLLKQGNSILRAYLTGWRASYKSKSPNDYLFPGHFHGKPICTRTIRKWAETVEQQAGIEDLSPHVLRKTYTTMLDSMGVSPLVIAQLVGHSSLKTTVTHYIKHDTASLVGALAKVHIPGVLAG